MPKKIFKIPTWTCSQCGYQQDFDPDDAEKRQKHFPEIPNLLPSQCPSCLVANAMVKETNSDKKMKVTVDGEEDVENYETEERDVNGAVVFDEKGHPKMRKLNSSEKNERKEKIRADIAKFEQIAEQ